MKAAIALASALFLTVLVFAAVRWSRSPAGSELDGVLSAEAAVPSDARIGPDAEGESGDALTTTGRGAVPAAAATEAAEASASEETWNALESLWVRGSVLASGPCAGDDRLVAYALARPAGIATLESALRAKPGEGEDQDLVLSRRPVGRDGSFELPVPPDSRRAHVIVRGRTLYMDRSRPAEPGSTAPLALSPRCGAALEGRVVVGAASKDVPGEVELKLSAHMSGLLTEESGHRRTAHARPDRSFALHAVPSARAFHLDADAPGFAPQRIEIEPLAPGETRRVEIHVGAGASVRGRVIDESGRPVAGAEVVGAVRELFGRSLPSRSATTDDAGLFHLTALAPDRVALLAKHDGYIESRSVHVELTEREERTGVELVLERGQAIAGTLRWPDGSPAVGVEVRAELDPTQLMGMGGMSSGRGREAKARTDETGAFHLFGLGKSRFDLSASARPPAEVADGFLAHAGQSATAADARGEKAQSVDADWTVRAPSLSAPAAGLELVLEPPRGVAGRVIDERGEPVPAFRIRAVLVVDSALGPMSRKKEERAFEDEGGRFHISGLTDGKWHFYALADGFSAPAAVSVQLPEAEAEVLVLGIQRASSVAGTVLTPHGQVVSGATVTIDTGSAQWTTFFSGAPEPPSAVSGGDGSFVLEDLPAGSHSLVARAEGYASAVSDALALEPARRLGGVELYLREGGTVTGEAYGSDGERAAGRPVQAVQMSTLSVHRGSTDAGGRFRFDHLDPGNWQVQTLPSQQQMTRIEQAEQESIGELVSEIKSALVDVKDGETVHVVLGAPPADPIDVRGRVTLRGEAFPDATVSFFREGKEMLQRLRTTTSGADGGYSVTLDGPGNYIATVQRFAVGDFSQQSSIEFQIVIPDVREHSADLAIPGGRISGRLRSAGGAPVAGERVNLYPAGPARSGTLWGGQYIEARSDDEGAFDLDGIRPGRYTVAVGGMAAGGLFGTGARYGRLVREMDVGDGQWVQRVDFRLEEAGKARVRAVDAAGRPVAGAAVFARDEDGRLVELYSMTTTDAKGVCEYGGLAPGRYSFSARKDGFASQETPMVRVDRETTPEVLVAVEEGTILLVKVVDGTGEGIAARIRVLDEDGREVGSMTSYAEILESLGSGGFATHERRVGPLPPGNYSVTAWDEDGRQETKPVRLRRQSDRRLTFHFRD